MTIQLWDWLEELDFLVGADFPKADEDALRRCGLAWAEAARDLRRCTVDAAGADDGVVAALGGAGADAFARSWQVFGGADSYFDQLAALCDQLAKACEDTALDVEYAKLQYIEALLVLAGTLAWLAGFVWFFGLSALGVPGAIATAQFTIRLVLSRLVGGILAGVLFNVGLDVGAQAVQLLDGHRDGWDWSKTRLAAGDGALYGGIGAAAFLGAGRLIPASAGRGVAGLGLVGAAGAASAVGGVIVPIVDGQALSAEGFAKAAVAGTVGGLGALHGRRPEHAGGLDLSRLDSALDSGLDPGLDSGLDPGLVSGLDSALVSGLDPGLAARAGVSVDAVGSALGSGPGWAGVNGELALDGVRLPSHDALPVDSAGEPGTAHASATPAGSEAVASGRSAYGPSGSGPFAAEPSASGPFASGPSASGPGSIGSLASHAGMESSIVAPAALVGGPVPHPVVGAGRRAQTDASEAVSAPPGAAPASPGSTVPKGPSWREGGPIGPAVPEAGPIAGPVAGAGAPDAAPARPESPPSGGQRSTAPELAVAVAPAYPLGHGGPGTSAPASGSEAARPSSAAARSAVSDSAGSQFAGSESAGSESAGSQFAGSEFAGSQFAGSESAGSQSALSYSAVSTADGRWSNRGGPDAGPAWVSAEGSGFLTRPEELAADRLLHQARRAEAAITPAIREIAAEVNGDLVESNRLKEPDSLKAKVARILRSPGNTRTADEVAAGIKDAVRYTIVLAEEGYTAGAAGSIARLLDRGFRPLAESRNWGHDSGYTGLNTAWRHEATGQIFEVQLHTPSSLHAKTVTHDLYAQLRELDDGPERDITRAAHDAQFTHIRVPDGAVHIGLPAPTESVPLAESSPSPARPPADPATAPLPADPATGLLPADPDGARARPPGDPLWSDPRHPVTDAEAVELAHEHVVATDAGLAFYPVDDDTRDFAAAIRPTAGYLTLDLHGSSTAFQIGDGLLTPHQFAAALRDLSDTGVLVLPEGIGLKLISCDTAAGGLSSPAAVLAREFGIEVVAPDQPVWTTIDGKVTVSSPTLVSGILLPTIPPDGHWIRFTPVVRAAVPDLPSPPEHSERPHERTPGQVPAGPGPPSVPGGAGAPVGPGATGGPGTPARPDAAGGAVEVIGPDAVRGTV